MIKVICFDLDGVYFINGKKNFIANLVSRGVTEEEAIRVFLKSDQMNQQYKTGRINDEAYWSWAAKQWGLNLSPQELIDLMIAGYEVNQPAAALVKKVREEGYKTAICSNNFPARINGLNKRFNFLADFDVVVVSYEVGVLKPDQKIFETLIEKSGVKPGEIVYSDDDAGKIEGATKLGVKTFVYEDFDQFCQELKKLGLRI
jgi:putative hydrolase of the HAD superfamily